MSISVTRLSRPTLGLAARAALCIAGGAIMAVNIRTFVSTGELLPGGFVGLALLIRETLARFVGLSVPFGLLYVLLNAVPVALSWRLIGHRYTALDGVRRCFSRQVREIREDISPSLCGRRFPFSDACGILPPVSRILRVSRTSP